MIWKLRCTPALKLTIVANSANNPHTHGLLGDVTGSVSDNQLMLWPVWPICYIVAWSVSSQDYKSIERGWMGAGVRYTGDCVVKLIWCTFGDG